MSCESFLPVVEIMTSDLDLQMGRYPCMAHARLL